MFPKVTGHSAGTFHGQKKQEKVQKRAMGSRSSDMWWNSDTTQLSRSLAGFLHIYSETTAKSLKINALVTTPARAVCLNDRGKNYLTSEGRTFVGLLSAGITELGVEVGDLEVDELVSLPRFTVPGGR